LLKIYSSKYGVSALSIKKHSPTSLFAFIFTKMQRLCHTSDEWLGACARNREESGYPKHEAETFRIALIRRKM
jgi:hypothetical protein